MTGACTRLCDNSDLKVLYVVQHEMRHAWHGSYGTRCVFQLQVFQLQGKNVQVSSFATSSFSISMEKRVPTKIKFQVWQRQVFACSNKDKVSSLSISSFWTAKWKRFSRCLFGIGFLWHTAIRSCLCCNPRISSLSFSLYFLLQSLFLLKCPLPFSPIQPYLNVLVILRVFGNVASRIPHDCRTACSAYTIHTI